MRPAIARAIAARAAARRGAIARRAIVAVAALSLLTIPTASAETVNADGDAVTVGDQTVIDLGSALPGADVPVTVTFRLECSGTSHLDAGQNLLLSPGPRTIPPGGSFSVGSVLLMPTAGWPADGATCPTGLAPVTATHRIVITATPDLATDLAYVFSWNRVITSPNASDATVLEGSNPSVTFLLDVVDNTPPTLDLPADFTVEGNTTGGAAAAYTVTADDAEDSTAPTPTCAPAVGAVLPLGANTISCSVTDLGGLETTASFVVTVLDTTAPVMPSVADSEVVTADPAGATVDVATPSLVELVDPHPTASCLPATGLFPVGTTTVTCTAQDASDNQSSMSYRVTVRYVPVMAWTARWGEPVGSSGATLVANAGRTVPVKVDLLAGGVRQTEGSGTLIVSTCGGPSVLGIPLTFDGSRWTTKLDTGRLGAGCFVATAQVNGQTAGSFRLDLRGDATAAKAPRR